MFHFRVIGIADPNTAAVDKSLLEARGPKWHKKDRQAGRIPKGLHGVDVESTWGYSDYHGWVQGYSYEVVVTATADEALVAAQQLREETRASAEREAQVILREAEAEGRRQIDGAERAEQDAHLRMAEVQRQFAGYLAGFRALLDRQLAELRALEGDRG